MTDSEYMEEAAVLRPRLVGTAWQYVGDEAEDVVQDAMMKLWDMRCNLHCPMEPMARVVVRNICVDRLRRRNAVTVVPLAGDEGLAAVADRCFSATAVCSAAAAVDDSCERVDRIMAIVDRLADRQRTVLCMRHLDGMEMGDIAEQTGSSEEAVRKALSRARQAVRDRYRQMRNKR